MWSCDWIGSGVGGCCVYVHGRHHNHNKINNPKSKTGLKASVQAQGWGTEADARLQALNGKRVAVGADFNPRCVRGRVCVCVRVMCLQDLGAGDGVWGVLSGCMTVSPHPTSYTHITFNYTQHI